MQEHEPKYIEKQSSGKVKNLIEKQVHNQVKNLDFSPCGQYLAAISFDEIDKKYYLDLYDPYKKARVARPIETNFSKLSLQWNPKKL